MTDLAQSFDTTMTRSKARREVESINLDANKLDDPPWVREVTERFQKLHGLKENWDSYGGSPIRKDVLEFAADVLSRVMRRCTPTPTITPMAHGGVMLEWHKPGVELEIEIEAPFRVWFSAEIEKEGLKFDVEDELTNDFRRLEPIIEALPPRRRV